MPQTTREPPVLLLTRPEAEARRFAALVAARAGPVRPVIAPLMEIVALGPPAPPEGVPVFTSAAAVPFAGPGGGAPAWCVGPRTADAARAAGWAPRTGGGDADALVAAILASGDPGPFVHLRGAHARGEVAARLRAAARGAAERVVYDQRALPLGAEAMAALAGTAPVVAPLFSPRSAALLVAAAGNRGRPPRVVAMSAAVAEVARAAGWPARVAARPDAEAMAAAVVECLAIDGPDAAG